MPAIHNIKPDHIAAVVSPHGFGHAARACAVLESLRAFRPDLQFEIFSQVPEWFFRESLESGFRYHAFPVDVGVVQQSPFEEDLPQTHARLKEFLANEDRLTERLADLLVQTGCRQALCDISPLGIRAAAQARIPSILIENFTWDWIYAGYFELEPGLIDIAGHLEKIFAAVDVHIQAEPICKPDRCDLVTRPVARKPRQQRELIREKLGVPPGSRLVLVTAGGIEQPYPGLSGLAEGADGIHFVIPGNSERFQIAGNTTLLPHHSDFFHPDLVYASDAAVGKLGYSTIAEAFYAGIPFAFVPRERFRETGPLAGFVRNNLGGFEIGYEEFITGKWASRARDLLDLPRHDRRAPYGADEAAGFILSSGLAPL
jgi:hypothetical protein